MNFSERVNRGAAWLDEIRPGWAGLIDTDRLCMDNPSDCILGQLFADKANRQMPNGYRYAAVSFFDDRDQVAADRGFLFTDEEWRQGPDRFDHMFAEQRDLWLKAIESRKGVAA